MEHFEKQNTDCGRKMSVFGFEPVKDAFSINFEFSIQISMGKQENKLNPIY
jgi:hypothetical protein